MALPENVRSNLNVPFFRSTGNGIQSGRNLSEQGTLNGEFERQEGLEVHLNMPIVRPDPTTMNKLSNEEKDGLAGMQYASRQRILSEMRQENC